jgi:prevent-host-death family protein
MKSLQISEDILPIGKFKTQASQVLRKLREAQRPIVITQNGKPTAVLITPEEFDRLHERDRFLAAVREGLADSEAGRVVEDKTLTRELDAALGKAERP